MLDEDEDDRVDETALQQLTEMGFPESRAIKALRLNQWVGAFSMIFFIQDVLQHQSSLRSAVCVEPKSFVCLSSFSLGSMSVTQAMEWLIEHVDDPSVDAPIPSQDSSAAAGAAAAAAATPSTSASGATLLRSLSSQSSTEESSRQDELTEIFKRIRRKREFRPDSRVSGLV